MIEQMDKSRLSGGLDSLLIKDRALEISVGKDQVPDFVLEANEQIRSGQMERARALLLDPARMPMLESIFQADPPETDTMYIVARLFLEIQQIDQAETWFRSILGIEPHAVVYHELAEICSRTPSRHSEAARLFAQAHALDPANPDYGVSAARMLIHVGQVERGIELLDKAILLSPQDPVFSSMRLWYQHYVPGLDRLWFAEQYRRWSEVHGTTHADQPFDLTKDPDRPLRVGLVSSSFCTGSIAHTLRPFLQAYDRATLELVGYNHGAYRDGVTEELRGNLSRLVCMRGWTQEEMARRIRADRIDILVDMGGHCHDNPVGLFRFQPAPIQVDYGGMDTTGIEAIGWRLTDDILDPAETLSVYPEKSVYLPGGPFFFVPPATSPPIGELPLQSRGFATFGSFNNNMKISDDTLILWCEVLRALPSARFVLKCPVGDDPEARDDYRERFARQGIAAERIDIVGMLPHDQYQALLASIDLVLDTFPFHGCITTLDALWMGVPPVTLLGDLWVSRMGPAVLQRLGLEVFVAGSAEDYVRKACRFVEQPEALDRIRRSLRHLMLDSPLCQPRRLARELEQAFRGMWHHWLGLRQWRAGHWVDTNCGENVS